MNRRKALIILIGLFCVAAGESVHEPTLPKAGLFKPTFLRLNGSWSAGTAFVVKDPNRDQLLLVTPDHLFGPNGGVEQQMTPDDIADQVCGAVGVSMQDKKSIIIASGSMKIADAHPLDKEGIDKDLVVFRLADKQGVDGFAFAKAVPASGARVWMFARTRGETEPRLFPAVVIDSSEKALVYRFTDKPFNAAGTSGAPVLDAEGEVVGMNVGGSETKGQQLGFANPAAAIRAELVKSENP